MYVINENRTINYSDINLFIKLREKNKHLNLSTFIKNVRDFSYSNKCRADIIDLDYYSLMFQNKNNTHTLNVNLLCFFVIQLFDTSSNTLVFNGEHFSLDYSVSFTSYGTKFNIETSTFRKFTLYESAEKSNIIVIESC